MSGLISLRMTPSFAVVIEWKRSITVLSVGSRLRLKVEVRSRVYRATRTIVLLL